MRMSTWVLALLIGMVAPCFGQGIEISYASDWSLSKGRDDLSPVSMQNRGIQLQWRSAKQTEGSRLAQTEKEQEKDYDLDDTDETEEDQDEIADPIEPFNRAVFLFNDRLYFWLLKPTATGYKYVVPEGARVSIQNFFSNIAMPVRAVNCLLQGKFRGFGIELLRFTINTTAGFLGFRDVAKHKPGLAKQDEDFDQTLGVWFFGPGFYINWPFFGPSSVRGTFGLVADHLLSPATYIDPPLAGVGIIVGEKVNDTSLSLGIYESLKDAAFDPYIALRDAYIQRQQKKIQE